MNWKGLSWSHPRVHPLWLDWLPPSHLSSCSTVTYTKPFFLLKGSANGFLLWVPQAFVCAIFRTKHIVLWWLAWISASPRRWWVPQSQGLCPHHFYTPISFCRISLWVCFQISEFLPVVPIVIGVNLLSSLCLAPQHHQSGHTSFPERIGPSLPSLYP